MDKISREYFKNNTGITIKQVPLVLFDEKTLEVFKRSQIQFLKLEIMP